MVTFFGVSVSILLLWAITRKMYLALVSRRFRYKIFELRDRLRRLAIEEKVDKDSWVFEYYDKSFSKTITDYYYLTAFRLFGSAVKMKGDKEFEEFSVKLESELEKNHDVKKIVDEYYSAVANYVFNQHNISMKFFIIPILSPIIGMHNLGRGFNAWSNKAINTPDLSDSGKYLKSI